MLLRLPETQIRRQTRTPAVNAVGAVVPLKAAAAAPWPSRPPASILSKSIPLFFISRDSDGFWIACEADFRIGGIFLSRRSAMRFAERTSAPTPCATMILSEPHKLDIENRGNRFVARLRPAKRCEAARTRCCDTINRARSPRALVARSHRGPHAARGARGRTLSRPIQALEQERRRPADRHRPTRTRAHEKPIDRRRLKRAWPVIIAFTIFGLVHRGNYRACEWRSGCLLSTIKKIQPLIKGDVSCKKANLPRVRGHQCS